MAYARILLFLLLFPFLLNAKTKTPPAKPRKVFTTTPVYDSIIATYQQFEKQSRLCKLSVVGRTDVGKPLHLFVISKDSIFSPEIEKKKGKAVVMINNGIHPGEPDGIDACIELTRTLLANPALIPDNVVICIVPVYNVDGCLNRGSYSRANQDGPVEYGFRGNAKNLDLNRDFIKADAENTLALEGAFRHWKPDVFIDTHVSDGADYQYVMTLIATQRNKLHPVLAEYMDKDLVPSLYTSMQQAKYPMCPYVETLGETPETGIAGFLETPRFSTGYAALFNCIGFVTETHMLKPYNDRVWATYELLKTFLSKINADAKKIVALHAEADRQVAAQKKFVISWKLDTTQYEWMDFKGYEAKHKTSEVTGQQRLYYDRSQPYTKKIKFYNTYVAEKEVTAPDFYIVPQGYDHVIYLLTYSGVRLSRLTKDTTIETEMSFIEDYQTVKNPYESHYLHSNVKTRREKVRVTYHAGDFVIPVNQACNRFIVETLEPEGGDSFFAWNFFDGILQQKEWFSDYVFEEKADSILKNDPQLKAALDAKRQSDTAFAANGWAQLNFVYQHSAYKEPTHNRYPVGRVYGEIELPVR